MLDFFRNRTKPAKTPETSATPPATSPVSSNASSRSASTDSRSSEPEQSKLQLFNILAYTPQDLQSEDAKKYDWT